MEISRRMIQRLTRSRGITLNRRPAYLRRKVRTGDRLAVRVADEEKPTLAAAEMELSIVYDDADVLVVDKPAGLMVHPTSPDHSRTLSHGIAHHFSSRGVEARVRPVHRLDRDTSGLIVIAKTAFAHQHLDRQLREGKLEREYLVLVQGELEVTEGVIDRPIGRAPGDPRRRAVTAEGQPAVTRYAVVERLRGATLARARLETGRTHQIRVHFAHLGHPVVGDTMYGARPVPGLRRHFLHASRVAFVQPRTGDSITCTAPLPRELERVIGRLREGRSGQSRDELLQENDGEERDDG